MKKNNINHLYKLFKDLLPCDITIDSREPNNNGLFFALKGRISDGNEHVVEAFNNGAKYAIISNENYAINDNCLLVENVNETLELLARWHRKSLNAKVIGITGSTGKTTTKELIFEVLKQKYKTHKAIGNYNTEIGLAISLLKAPIDTEMIVLEMGANKHNDIAHLCKIAEPTHGVILNIQESHLETFGDLEGVFKAKFQLYEYLSYTRGVFFLNTNDKSLEFKRHIDILTFVIENKIDYSEFDISIINQTPFIEYQYLNSKITKTNLIGEYQKNNIAVAYKFGEYFGVDEEKIHDAISNYIPLHNRAQLLKIKNKNILLDAYNANIHSMKGALNAFKMFKNQVLILGSIKELGLFAYQNHENLGHLLVEYSKAVDCEILLLGAEMNITHSLLKKSKLFLTKPELEEYLSKNKNNSVESSYLLKGSRYWCLETLMDVILMDSE